MSRDAVVDALIDAGLDCRDAGVQPDEFLDYVDALVAVAWPSHPRRQARRHRPVVRLSSFVRRLAR